MSAPKFTPGPWVVREITAGRERGHFAVGHAENLSDRGGSFVAQVNGLFDDEAEPNAHLIAAAPDLCAALEEMMEFEAAFKTLAAYSGSSLHGAVKQARAALAKARGES